jgi:hypothetical protein
MLFQDHAHEPIRLRFSTKRDAHASFGCEAIENPDSRIHQDPSAFGFDEQ